MEKEKKVRKAKSAPAKFWPTCVKVFFDFVAEKFDGEKPTFDGSSPRDLKSIVLALEKRAMDAGVDWTEETAAYRLRKFLEASFNDPWLGKNFLLFNLNRQKDKIFLNRQISNNGQKPTSVVGKNIEFDRP